MADEAPGGFLFESFLRESIRAGESMRASIARFRQAGGSIGNETFREAYKIERDRMAAGPGLADIPTYTTPTHDMYLPWKAGKAGRYGTLVEADIWDRGIGAFVTQPWLVYSDEPIPIQQAIDQMVDEFENGEPDNPNYGWGRIGAVRLSQLRYTV